MFIDIGAKDKKEAVETFGVKPGDSIIFASNFRSMKSPNMFVGKNFDNRLGIASLIEITQEFSKKSHPNTIIPILVQEEKFLRGISVITTLYKSDIAIIIGNSPSDDFSVTKHSKCILGSGPHLQKIETKISSNPVLYKFITKIADKYAIPYQSSLNQNIYKDDSIIHNESIDLPCIIIRIPVRYAQMHYSMFHLEDYRLTVKLLIEALRELNNNTYK